MVKNIGRKFGLLALKLLIVFAAFYYVVSHTNFERVWEYIEQANVLYLAIALMIFLVMKFVMAVRLRQILSREGNNYNKSYMYKNLLSGFFLNLALPGFVGGDGYVSFRLLKDKKLPLKTSIKAMINSRASGFFYVCCFFYIFFLSSGFANLVPRAELLVGSVFVLQVLVYHLFAKYYFKESLMQFFQTSVYSLAIQVLAVGLIFSVLKSINVTSHFMEYTSVFFFGETVSMIPITPMGLGLRELIFFNAANQVGIFPEKAVAVSMIVFGVFVATAIVGLIFYFSNKEKKDGSS